MTDDPARLTKIGTIASGEEADAFTDQLRRLGLRMTGEEMDALAQRRKRVPEKARGL